MDQLRRNYLMERNISLLIHKHGGRLALSDFVFHFSKDYNCASPVPSGVKLSDWIRKFQSINLERNRQNNQMYITQKKMNACKQQEVQQRIDPRQQMIEKRIVAILTENKDRVQLSNLALKYRTKFNEELLLPVGLKLSKWIGSFPSVLLDHDMSSDQMYLKRREKDDKQHRHNNTLGVEQNILNLLENNHGCLGLSNLTSLYNRTYSQALYFPAGISLSQWLCTFDSIVLTKKPSNNEAYICIKHPAHATFDCLSRRCPTPMKSDKEDIVVLSEIKEIRNEISGLAPNGIDPKLSMTLPTPQTAVDRIKAVPAKTQQEAVRLSNWGEFALHSKQRTKAAIKDGTAILAQCLNCDNSIQVAGTATLLICPICDVVSPVLKGKNIHNAEKVRQEAELMQKGGNRTAIRGNSHHQAPAHVDYNSVENRLEISHATTTPLNVARQTVSSTRKNQGNDTDLVLLMDQAALDTTHGKDPHNLVQNEHCPLASSVNSRSLLFEAGEEDQYHEWQMLDNEQKEAMITEAMMQMVSSPTDNALLNEVLQD